MHVQDLFAALDVRTIHQHVTVKATRTHQCGIQCLGAVRCTHHNHTVIGSETIHLYQQSIQGLLTLVVTARCTTATHLTQCVQLVDEDDRRRTLQRLLKHVANTSRSNTHVHLDEV